MNYCQCERPRVGRNPDFCGFCLVRLGPSWVSSDRNLRPFMARVASLPTVTAPALIHAQKREKAGRVEFGLSYIGRNNDTEGREEAADGLIYTYLSWLNDRRAGTEEVDPDLLDAAYHFALAHAALERRKQ